VQDVLHQLFGQWFKFRCPYVNGWTNMTGDELGREFKSIISNHIIDYTSEHNLQRIPDYVNVFHFNNVWSNFQNPPILPEREFLLFYPGEFTPNQMCREEYLGTYPFVKVPNSIRPKGRSFVDVTGFVSPHAAVEEVFEILSSFGVSVSKLVVNIGANDGACHSPSAAGNYDPANCAAHHFGWGGVFIEADAKSYQHAVKAFAGRDDLTLLNVLATPDTVVDLVFDNLKSTQNSDGTIEIDILKIDIDHSDCTFARKLVQAGLRPKVVHIEVNSVYPPPFIFREHFDGNLGIQDTISISSGCSISAVMEDVGPEYRLVQVEFEDIMLLRQDIAGFFQNSYKDPELLWRIGYLCQPLSQSLRLYSMLTIQNYKLWADKTIPVQQRLEWIKHALGDDPHNNFDLGILNRYDTPLGTA
jgi:hypothetical protein